MKTRVIQASADSDLTVFNVYRIDINKEHSEEFEGLIGGINFQNDINELEIQKEELIKMDTEINEYLCGHRLLNKTLIELKPIDILIDAKKYNINDIYLLEWEINNFTGGPPKKELFLYLYDIFSYICDLNIKLYKQNEKYDDECIIANCSLFMKREQLEKNKEILDSLKTSKFKLAKLTKKHIRNCCIHEYPQSCTLCEEYYNKIFYIIPKLFAKKFKKWFCEYKPTGKGLYYRSKKEIKFGEELRKIYPNLIAAYRVKSKCCDFYDKGSNKIIEFLGDFYHGNLNRYHSEKLNTKCKKTMGQLNLETIQKFNELYTENENIYYCWENRFDEYIKNINNYTSIENILKKFDPTDIVI